MKILKNTDICFGIQLFARYISMKDLRVFLRFLVVGWKKRKYFVLLLECRDCVGYNLNFIVKDINVVANNYEKMKRWKASFNSN